MTYFWTGTVVVLLTGIGLIVWGSLSGPGRSGGDVAARRTLQTQIGALMVVVSLGVLVTAYLTADWP
ncbi:hypothetical protein FHX52_0917 [Humibacillus xanthopallidus]|uniref:Uncharacterized protein n=1 Tax=Humibacillus xanthopallidus TaxID=412689 RepID=A0A543PUQ0_9MICO|nr:hypothetical protein [Humibacillus xanthopallidus]TQN47799.1 hypothetical protein FHX52_0917 [Humibacillus xanthopallidus]